MQSEAPVAPTSLATDLRFCGLTCAKHPVVLSEVLLYIFAQWVRSIRNVINTPTL